MKIKDSIFNLAPGRKDIISWNVKNNVLSLKVRKSVVQQMFKLASIRNSSCITKDIVEQAIARENYENIVKYNKELKAYEEKKKAWDELNKEQKKNITKPCKPQKPKKIKVKYTNIFFSTAVSRRAFVKSYFLFELLVHELGIKEGFLQEDFIRSLKHRNDKTTIIDFQRIRKRLQYEGILYTNTKDHYESVAKTKTNITKYHYVFHTKGFSEDQSDDSTKVFYYKIVGTVKDIISKAYKMKNVEEHEIQEGGLEAYLRECAGDISLENLHNSLTNNVLHDPNNLNNVWNSTNKIPFNIYIAPYEILSFKGLTNYDLVRFGSFRKLKVWLRHHKEKATVTESTRIFHSFHNIPRDYRKKLAYKGSLLTEVMDVHNCFYVLMLKVMLLSESIDKSELRKYENMVKSGKFYEEVEKYVHFDLPVFPDDEYGINWSEEYYLWFRGLNKRDLVKKWLQSYRNLCNEGQAYHNHKNIDNFFRKEIPSIRKWLFSYPQTKNGKEKTVKRLQSDMCLIESYIISRVCIKLTKWGVTPFSLHDGIYLSEEHIAKIREFLILEGDNQVREFVSKLFWEEFDRLTPYYVKQLIDRNFYLLPYNYLS